MEIVNVMTIDGEIIHVLDENKSSIENIVWTMWCGDQCVPDGDGNLTPDMDFYLERDANKSNCNECLKKYLSRNVVNQKKRVCA
jgi:hypothetical protein